MLKDFDDLTTYQRSCLMFDLQKVWQEEKNINAEMSHFRSLIKESGFPITDLLLEEYESCYADKHYQATINYNGEVFKCTARDFTIGSGEGKLNSGGSILWNERYEKRLNIKFKNKPCEECRILPICRGGCSQHALENESIDYCVMGFDEDAKVRAVVTQFKELFA